MVAKRSKTICDSSLCAVDHHREIRYKRASFTFSELSDLPVSRGHIAHRDLTSPVEDHSVNME